MDDPTERITILWYCAPRSYEKIAIQKSVGVLVRPTGTANHSAGAYLLFESETTVTTCGAEVVGYGAVGGRKFRAPIAAQAVR